MTALYTANATIGKPRNDLTTTQDSDAAGANSPARAVVFIDAQNMYMGAREAFGWTDYPGHYGNFKPVGLARVLTSGADRALTQVRIYTGVPTPQKDPRGNAAQQRRIAAWIADNPRLVEVFPRPLRYAPGSRKGTEKGIDVELAVDLVGMAIDNEYDIAILASADTDLVPPLEYVHRRFPDKVLETVSWEPEPGYEAVTAAPIDIPGGGAIRRTVGKHQFDRIADRRNFLRDSRAPASVVGESRWAGVERRLGP